MSKVPLNPRLRKQAASVLLTLWAVHASPALGAITSKSAQELLERTTFNNVLRTDAEQAALLADRLSEDLPSDLRSDLRRVFDRNLSYNATEAMVVKDLSVKIGQSQLDQSSRWWASDSGRTINAAESRGYASLFPDSSFQAFNPAVSSPSGENNGRALKAIADGHFADFVETTIGATIVARACLTGPMDRLKTCPSDVGARVPAKENLARVIQAAIRMQYSSVSVGDLDAYITFRGKSGSRSAEEQIRITTARVLSHAWSSAMKDAAAVLDDYSHLIAGKLRQPTLEQTMIDVDGGRNLGRADFLLRLMQREGPPDPEVLVQLARVTLKRAPDHTINDGPPSVPQIDAQSLRVAEQLLDDARRLDSTRGDAWMLAGHVYYLKQDFQHALESLDKANALGTDNPWLHVNRGDVLWAMAYPPPVLRRDTAQQAAGEFEKVLTSSTPAPAQERAVHQLGPIYAELGDNSKAAEYYRRYISYKEGRNKAFALHRYAHFLLFYAKDTDMALAAARQAVQTSSFPLGRTFLAQMLSIKAGTLAAAGRGKEASTYIAEAREIQPDLESLCPELARLSAMFPGVVGIHAAGLVRDFSGSIGGQTLVYATLYATSEQMEQLLSWGANPNYFDPEEGTALHHAILANNIAAVKVLLAHGANPTTPYVDGRAPSELTDETSDAKRPEILAIVSKAAGATTALAGTPLKPGYDYEVRKGLEHGGWGSALAKGDRITFVSNQCRYADATLACLVVKTAGGRLTDVAISKDQLVGWEDWFKELGPSSQN